MTGEYDIETPALRVNIYQHRRLIAQVLCESADEAADVIAQYDDAEGIEYEVDDLAAAHGTSDVRAAEPEDALPEDEYRD
jgi:hypothetical protein